MDRLRNLSKVLDYRADEYLGRIRSCDVLCDQMLTWSEVNQQFEARFCSEYSTNAALSALESSYQTSNESYQEWAQRACGLCARAFPEITLRQHCRAAAYCFCTGLSDIDAGKELLLWEGTAKNILSAFLFYKLILRKRSQKPRVEQVRDELDSESQGSRACRVSQDDLREDSSTACSSAETETSDTLGDFLSNDCSPDRVEGYPDPHELPGKEVCSLDADPPGQMARDCHISTCDEPSESQSNPMGGGSDIRPDNCKSDISSHNDDVQQHDENCTAMPLHENEHSDYPQGAWLVELQVNGADVRAVVDTGAETSMLSYSVVEQMNPQPEVVAETTIKTAMHGDKMQAYELAPVSIKLGSQHYQLPVCVGPLRDQMLLGLDFMRENYALVDTGEGALVIGDQIVKLIPTKLGQGSTLSAVIARRFAQSADYELLCTQDAPGSIQEPTEVFKEPSVQSHLYGVCMQSKMAQSSISQGNPSIPDPALTECFKRHRKKQVKICAQTENWKVQSGSKRGLTKVGPSRRPPKWRKIRTYRLCRKPYRRRPTRPVSVDMNSAYLREHQRPKVGHVVVLDSCGSLYGGRKVVDRASAGCISVVKEGPSQGPGAKSWRLTKPNRAWPSLSA